MVFPGIHFGAARRRGTPGFIDDQETGGGAPTVPIGMPPTGQQLGQNIAQTLAAPPPPGAKPGFFKKGGMGQHMLGGAIGSIGDALVGNTAYADSVSDQRKSMLAEQMAEMKRQQENEDFYARKRFEWANKPPDRPGIFDEFSAYGQMDPKQRPAFDAYLSKRFPSQMAGPPPITTESGASIQTPTQQGAPGAGGQPRTATGPDGRKMIFNPQTGQWEPLNNAVPRGSPLDPNLGRY